MRRAGCGVLVLLVCAAAIVGAVVFLYRKFTAEPEVYSLCPADRSSTEVVRPSKILDGARRYAGPGPHRIVIIGPSDSTGALPAEWITPRIPNGWAHEVAELELVACEYVYAVGAEPDLGTCTWNEIGGSRTASVTVQSAKYDYRIFEAANGRLLTTLTVNGVHGECAKVVSIRARPAYTTAPAGPDLAALRQLLEPLVTAPAG
jgi:hypothetical protein